MELEIKKEEKGGLGDKELELNHSIIVPIVLWWNNTRRSHWEGIFFFLTWSSRPLNYQLGSGLFWSLQWHLH